MFRVLSKFEKKSFLESETFFSEFTVSLEEHVHQSLSLLCFNVLE